MYGISKPKKMRRTSVRYLWCFCFHRVNCVIINKQPHAFYLKHRACVQDVLNIYHKLNQKLITFDVLDFGSIIILIENFRGIILAVILKDIRCSSIVGYTSTFLL